MSPELNTIKHLNDSSTNSNISRFKSPNVINQANSALNSPNESSKKPPSRHKNRNKIIIRDNKTISKSIYNGATVNVTLNFIKASNPVSPESISSNLTKTISPSDIVSPTLYKNIQSNGYNWNDVSSKQESSASRSLFRSVYSPQSPAKYDYNLQLCENEEDFVNTTESEFRKDFDKMIQPLNTEENKLRENLICKMKKICDDYDLSDDTFFRTVFIYDLLNRVEESNWKGKCKLENKALDELFTFGEGEEGKKKIRQYEKFFIMLSCLTIAIKYYEHERASPGVMHILKFFCMEKLKVKIKTPIKELEEIEDVQEIIVEIIYEYICEKQAEILFRINWKLQIVNIKHFVDHFIRILPDYKSLRIPNIKNHFSIKNNSKEKTNSNLLSRKMINLHKELNEEIEDCIDSVSKLAPLVPCYIEYTCTEIGAASLVIAIKHSLKTMKSEAAGDK